jgi:small basic protein (TIGR04137 family)
MSIHRSLRGVDTLVGERSVFKRIERLQKLIHDGKRGEEDSPYGLPKVRTKWKVKTKRKKTAEEEAAAEAAAEEAPAAPAESE